MSPVSSIDCLQCHAALPVQAFAPGASAPGVPVKCPHCDNPIQAEIFPAFYRKPAPVQFGELLLVEGDSSCFYHPQKKAALACEGCGRFLCSLCDVEFAGRHLCPACIESGKSKKKIKNLETERVMYDELALIIAIVPAITVIFSIITAPIALYLSLRHWNSPRSIIPRTRIRFVLAIIISLIQILFWTVKIYNAFRH